MSGRNRIKLPVDQEKGEEYRGGGEGKFVLIRERSVTRVLKQRRVWSEWQRRQSKSSPLTNSFLSR